MYRASLRSSAQLARAVHRTTVSGGARRLASTAAGGSGSTWKGSAARWGLAAGALYWYNTSPIFADEAVRQGTLSSSATSTVDSATATSFSPDESEFRTVDALLEEKQKAAAEKKKAAAAAAAAAAASKKEAGKTDTAAAATPSSAEKSVATSPAPNGGEGAVAIGDGSPEALEQEASQQGAFNPETGEINWDCPCLGGMADGPCGEDFKAAFSCFVYSTEEPKGMDCIEKFQHMQDCFRQHPEIYAAELADDEPEGEGNGPDDQKQQLPPPVEGVADGVAAASEPQPTDVKPAVSEKATTEKATTEKAAPEKAAPSTKKTTKAAKAAKAAKTAQSDATAENSKMPAPAAAASSAPATPAKAATEDVVQADATLFHSTSEPESHEAISAHHVPQAAFDATGANKK